MMTGKTAAAVALTGLILRGVSSEFAPAVAAMGASPAGAAEPAIAMSDEATERCSSLIATPPANAVVESADIVTDRPGVGSYCHVRGYAKPTIRFDLKLPLSGWNKKFYMAGCGGFCGVLDDNNGLNGLKRGYAVVTTDTGHSGQSLLDTSWVPGHPAMVVDFAYRGVAEAARVGKALTRAFYGSDIAFSYFDGCSNGGRQALMEATHNPEDFDGIIAGAPGFDIKGGMSVLVNIAKADIGPDGKPIFDPAKVGLVANAVARSCGDETGLVNAPLSCAFDPGKLECNAGDGPNCLTKAEVGVLRKWYSPPRLKNGKPLFISGVVPGSEPFWYHPSPYSNAVLGDAKMIAIQALNNLSPGLPADLTIARYDPETQSSLLGAALTMATPDPDLRRFQARKGKLLIYHGWADPTLPPARTIAFYNEAVRSVGGAAQSTARLFMIPGMSHCANPPGVKVPGFDRNSFDPLATLEQWVEKGQTPNAILATKFDTDQRPLFTRPICAYPATATYKGVGDKSDARNWICRSRSETLGRGSG